MACAVIPWIFKWCRCTLAFHDILYLQVPFVHCAFQSDSLSGWVGWKAEGRRLNRTLSTWIWPQLILRGSISFCSSKIGWETELGLINLQQIRVDHGKKKAERRKCLEIWLNHTTDTILPDCGFVKGLQMRITFWMNRASHLKMPRRNVDYEWKCYSKQTDLVSCGVGCSCQTIATCESWLIRFYNFFFSRSRFWWFKLQ